MNAKKSTDKPWIVLKNDKVINHIGDELPVYYTRNCSEFIRTLKHNNQFKSDLFFKKDRSMGYSIQTAFNNGADKSFEAIQSVTKACEYFSNKLNERRNTAAFYFPVILIEGHLFEGQFQNDEVEIVEVRNSEVLITRSFHKHGNSHLMIFEDSHLDEVAIKLSNLAEDFFKEYEETLSDSFDDYSRY